jgi:hypothetical protein
MYAAALQQVGALSSSIVGSSNGSGGSGSSGGSGVPPSLREWEDELQQRLQGCRGRLLAALSGSIAGQLAACRWPPKIAGGGDADSSGGFDGFVNDQGGRICPAFPLLVCS